MPCLHLTGTKDASPIDPKVKPEDRRLPYDHIRLADQYLVIFKDADHMVFSGRGKLPGGNRDTHFQKYILTATTRFWDAYLKDDPAAKRYLTDGGLGKALGEEATVVEHKLGMK